MVVFPGLLMLAYYMGWLLCHTYSFLYAEPLGCVLLRGSGQVRSFYRPPAVDTHLG
jgi:hypothetical protein